jgi:radical SAM-linked protein
MKDYGDEKISLSVSSLHPSNLTEKLTREIRKVRKTGFTIAPEAGSQRLRDVINKKTTRDEILDAASRAYGYGWHLLKLYFMLGLPTETEEDILQIARLVRDIAASGGTAGRKRKVNLNISFFVPKPHTPFQWEGMAGRETLKDKITLLRRHISPKRVKFNWHDMDLSMLEAVFSRGDRRLADVIEEAWRRGCRFDGWTDHFQLAPWLDAFRAAGLDPAFYANRTLETDAGLPWGHVSTGVQPEFLLRERDDAFGERVTPRCEGDQCRKCGVCGGGLAMAFSDEDRITAASRAAPAAAGTGDWRYRVRFTKSGPSRFISHLDLIRLIERALLRAGVRLSYSQGHHPHPKLSFGPALRLGIESRDEYFDFVSPAGDLAPALLPRLNEALCGGVEATALRKYPRHMPALSSMINYALYAMASCPPEWRRGAAELLKREQIPFLKVRGDQTKKIDIRPAIHDVYRHREKAQIFLGLFLTGGLNVFPEDVFKLICPGRTDPPRITRERLLSVKGDQFISPLTLDVVDPHRDLVSCRSSA